MKKRNIIQIAFLSVIICFSASPVFASSFPSPIPAFFLTLSTVTWVSVYIWIYKNRTVPISLINIVSKMLLSTFFLIVLFYVFPKILIKYYYSVDFYFSSYLIFPILSYGLVASFVIYIHKKEPILNNFLKESAKGVFILLLGMFLYVAYFVYSRYHEVLEKPYLITITLFVFLPFAIITFFKRRKSECNLQYDALIYPALIAPSIVFALAFFTIFQNSYHW